MTEYKAFMAHIPQPQWKAVAKHFAERFKDRDYLVVGEMKPYEHLHYLVKMTDHEYRNYANSVFRQKYKLRGRAIEGLARQYGKIREIKDLERLKAYMLKDGIEYNINVWTSLDKNDLKKLYDSVSFEKKIKEPHKKFVEYLKNHDVSERRSFGQLQQYIVTVEKLATIWLKEIKTRLPRRDSLLYYAYQAMILSEKEYIDMIYGVHKDDYFKHQTL